MHCIPGALFDPHAAELEFEAAAGRIQPAAPNLSAPTPSALMRLFALVLCIEIALVCLLVWLA